MGSLSRQLAGFVLVLSTPERLGAQDLDPAPPPAEAAVPARAVEKPPAVPPPRSTPVHAAPGTPSHTTQKPGARAEDRRREDAHVDRVLVLPTAETQPQGTLTLSSYDIAVLQVGYAFSDASQLTFTTTPPFGEVVPLDLTLKTTVARGPRHRLALLGAVSGIAGIEESSLFVGRAGFVGQVCFGVSCRSSMNLGGMALLAGAVVVASGTGLVVGISERWSILVELDLLLPTSRRVASVRGAAGGAGVRWSGRRWALDAGAFTAFDTTTPLPLVVFSYRFLREP